MIKVRKCESIDFKRKFMGKIYRIISKKCESIDFIRKFMGKITRIRLRKCASIDLMAAILIISLSLLRI